MTHPRRQDEDGGECDRKTTEQSACEAGFFTYLKLKRLKLGFLLNFGANLMKDGIERIVNGLPKNLLGSAMSENSAFSERFYAAIFVSWSISAFLAASRAVMVIRPFSERT